MPRLPSLPRLFKSHSPLAASRIRHSVPLRTLSTAGLRRQQPSHSSSPSSFPETPGPPRYNFYRTHGRAFFKSFTLAFLTMQIVQWAWLVFETEEQKDAKNAQIQELQSEVRLLDEGRGSHRLRVEEEEKNE